jgi:hypothetical protein
MKTSSKSTKATKTAKASKATKPAPTKSRKAPAAKASPKQTAKQPPRDPRQPAVGTKLTRTFKGKEIVVEVVEGGFKYQGQTFTSISACARHIVGYMISGPVFFKLVEPKRPEAK